jgi:sulfite reductase beta subunit-like hemoprotein
VADIGLTGHSVTDADGVQRPYYSILVGGSVGEGRGRVGRRLGRFAEEAAPQAIVALARFYEQERRSGERFPDFIDRIGMERAGEVAGSPSGGS